MFVFSGGGPAASSSCRSCVVGCSYGVIAFVPSSARETGSANGSATAGAFGAGLHVASIRTVEGRTLWSPNSTITPYWSLFAFLGQTDGWNPTRQHGYVFGSCTAPWPNLCSGH